MVRRTLAGLGLLLLALGVSWCAPARAESLVENSVESQFQLDFHVPDAKLKAFLPAGWEVAMAAEGPAKDANLRLVFIDRMNITGADAKPVGSGVNQLVFVTVPMKETATGVTGNVVIAGVTAEPSNVPGPFGVYMAAKDHKMTRSTSAGSGAALIEEQNWSFSAATGEHFETHVTYERVASNRLTRELKFFSGVNPKNYQISKIDQGINIARNATVKVPDRVKEFRYKVSGGKIASLFDGTERVLSVDIFPWYHQAITVP